MIGADNDARQYDEPLIEFLEFLTILSVNRLQESEISEK
jgi:hypothetical protein